MIIIYLMISSTVENVNCLQFFSIENYASISSLMQKIVFQWTALYLNI